MKPSPYKQYIVKNVAKHLNGCKCVILQVTGKQCYVVMKEGLSKGHGVIVYENELEGVLCET